VIRSALVARRPLTGYASLSVDWCLHPLSTRLRRNRLVAFIAALTLIVALGAYSAHGLADRGHDNGHCDLCVHFSGTAGSPAHASVVGKPVLVVRAPLERPESIRSARRRVGTQLPRAPPDSLLT
jgi:hypothetical protein